MIDKGQLVACGTLDELRAQAGSGGARLDQIFRTLTRSADPAHRAREILDASGAGNC
ncbi:MAG: hypothetical protein HZB39_04990 [Planctomycetes bacterium]|nr:hypothetical protein [Planctomycetota bacterium]